MVVLLGVVYVGSIVIRRVMVCVGQVLLCLVFEGFSKER